MENLQTTIGLEVHIQLATKSKMFCRCDNDAECKAPNTTVCPICLGMPGMLPVINRQAIEWTVKTGLVFGCEIPKLSKFDRKHYFYPDLPKGYQISQYDQPLCRGGYLEIKSQITNRKSQINSKLEISNNKKIRLNRIHLEEDAGKLIHKDGASLVDLNRAGTPLMEIVTEPDISSAAEAAEFLRKLQKIVRDVVKVSEASMEKGHLRCDANISITTKSQITNHKSQINSKPQMSEIVEIKNINSFKFVEKALAFEEKRLIESFDSWPSIRTKVTRGFNSQTCETYEQRTKEEASDYRYFPEPDLPPIDSTKFDLELLKSSISENEEDKIARLKSDGLNENDVRVLVNSMKKYDVYSKLSEYKIDKNFLAKTIVHNYIGFEISNEDIKNAKDYVEAVKLLSENKINKDRFQNICREIKSGKTISQININVESKDNIEEIVDKVIASNQGEVERYKKGEKQLLGYFVGQVMKESERRADPKEARNILQDLLDYKS